MGQLIDFITKHAPDRGTGLVATAFGVEREIRRFKSTEGVLLFLIRICFKYFLSHISPVSKAQLLDYIMDVDDRTKVCCSESISIGSLFQAIMERAKQRKAELESEESKENTGTTPVKKDIELPVYRASPVKVRETNIDEDIIKVR